MLSAIAARKAAQVAKVSATSQSDNSASKNASEVEQGSDSDSERRIKSFLQQSRSKRRSVEGKSVARKRRKKNTKSEVTQSRYYDIRDEAAQVIEVNESSSSSSSDDDAVEQEVRFAEQDLQDIIQLEQHQKSSQAWSPSAPPPASSDDEPDFSTPGPSSTPLSAFTRRHERTQDSGYQPPLPLTFAPRPGKNVFYIDESESDTLSGRKGTIVTLEQDETMALLGVYSLTVLRGTVSALGSELHASPTRPHTIFAPKCSPVPIITALPSDEEPSCSLPERIASVVSPGSAVLLLEDTHTGVEGLGRVCKTFENVFDASSIGDGVLNLSGANLMSSTSRSIQPFQLPDSWKAALSSVSPSASNEDDSLNLDPLVLLVRGQKRTGKSTMARTLLNRLVCRYRRVAYLECDVGQTEFTPPGLVSLHIVDRPIFGPPFTHPRLPYASHFTGSTSPRNSPEHYLAAVSALLQTFKIDVQYPAPEDELDDSDSEDDRIIDVVPLVINTMGWMKGLGADLARRIEEMVEPTHVFSTQSRSSGAEETFLSEKTARPRGSDVRSSDSQRIFEVEAITPGAQSMRYSAADWRTISLMSYFHSIPSPAQYEFLPTRCRLSTPTSFDRSAPLCTWDCRLPLVAQSPFAVSPAEAIDDIVLVGAGMEDIVPSEIARVLNGAVVALVSCEPDLAGSSSRNDQKSTLPYIQGAPPPDPSTSTCIGLALIRGVSPSFFDTSAQEEEQNDAESDVLQVLTPIPPPLMAASAARCFVKGEIELPVWGMLDYRDLEHGDERTLEKKNVPYLQWSKSDVVGSDRRRVRRNIMRKGQM